MIDLNRICKLLERERCIVHEDHPKATVEGNSIKIIACCKTFHNKLEGYVDKQLSDQLDKSVDDVLGSL